MPPNGHRPGDTGKDPPPPPQGLQRATGRVLLRAQRLDTPPPPAAPARPGLVPPCPVPSPPVTCLSPGSPKPSPEEEEGLGRGGGGEEEPLAPTAVPGVGEGGAPG